MKTIITVSKFNIIDFGINSDLYSKNECYLIPTAAYDSLITYLYFNENDNNETFIKNFVKIVNLITERQNEELSSKSFKEITKDYNKYLTIINNLIKRHGYVNPKYSNTDNSKCFEYYFTDLHLDWALITFQNQIDKSNITNKLPKLHPANRQCDTLINTSLDLSGCIADEYHNIFIDGYDFENIKKKDVEKLTSRITRALSFEYKKRFIKKGNENEQGRVFSSFTSLTKIARKHIYINNKPFFEIDIKNAQPLLLACDLINRDFDLDLNYIEDVMNGVFYEKLMSYALINNIIEQNCYVKGKTEKLKFKNRENVKVLTYANIFFKFKSKEDSVISYIFSELYPLTYLALCDSINDEKMATKLQNLESDIILNINPLCNFFTVHDAIYISNVNFIENVKNEIVNKVKELSFDKISRVNFGLINKNLARKKVCLEKTNIVIEISNKTKKHTSSKHKDSRKNKINKLLLSGYNKEKIANKLGISINYINKVIRENKENL